MILEALRKLDREKQTPERSLVVTGASDWARSEARAGRGLALALAAALSAGGLFFVWQSRTAHAPVATRHAPPPGSAPAPPVPLGGANDTPVLASAPQPRPLPLASARPAARAAESAAPGTTTPSAAPGALIGAGVAMSDAEQSGIEAAPASDAPREVAPATPATRPRDTIELQAIAERDGSPIAIVNGRLVREGDVFDGIRIVRIGTAEVEVEVQGRRRTIGF